MSKMIAFIDGGARPSCSGIGVVLTDFETGLRLEVGLYIGVTSNNVAEYKSLLLALELAHSLKADYLAVFSDSELIVKQINGEYSCKNGQLQICLAQCKQLINKFRHFEISHIPREHNGEADRLCNLALDRKLGKKTRKTKTLIQHKEIR